MGQYNQPDTAGSDEDVTKSTEDCVDEEWEDIPKERMSKKKKIKCFKVKHSSLTGYWGRTKVTKLINLLEGKKEEAKGLLEKNRVSSAMLQYRCSKFEQLKDEKLILEETVNQKEGVISELKGEATDTYNITVSKFMEELKDAYDLTKFMQDEYEVLEKKLVDCSHEASEQHSVLHDKLTKAYRQCDVKESYMEELEKKLQDRQKEETDRSYKMHECVTNLDELLGVERMAVKKEQDKVAKLEQAVVTLEMQVSEAGNEKMVGFLWDLIEKKQRFLECPVCLEEAASPILCCPELHLVCSSCQPSLDECPECRIR